jgi:hypothetical protein
MFCVSLPWQFLHKRSYLIYGSHGDYLLSRRINISGEDTLLQTKESNPRIVVKAISDLLRLGIIKRTWRSRGMTLIFSKHADLHLPVKERQEMKFCGSSNLPTPEDESAEKSDIIGPPPA